jgi:hypothetical protein
MIAHLLQRLLPRPLAAPPLGEGEGRVARRRGQLVSGGHRRAHPRHVRGPPPAPSPAEVFHPRGVEVRARALHRPERRPRRKDRVGVTAHVAGKRAALGLVRAAEPLEPGAQPVDVPRDRLPRLGPAAQLGRGVCHRAVPGASGRGAPSPGRAPARPRPRTSPPRRSPSALSRPRTCRRCAPRAPLNLPRFR